MKKYLKIFLIFGLLIWIGPLSSSQGQLFFLENPIVGKSAPDFSLGTLTEKNVNFTKYRDGQKALVFFWATWCPHCRKELDGLSKRREEFANKKIKLVIVDLGESPALVQKYVDKNKIELPMFLDTDQTLAEAYNLIGVPTFFFVNAQGVVESVEHSLPEDYDKFFTSS